ncbi:MAG: calcium-translocating P-type ATPase, PMCA-type [Clostridiales bacterium]|nr:calcium-translocating P-type ATPase, PMCA-type [Clostridiales bacterium]
MNFYDKSIDEAVKNLGSHKKLGLDQKMQKINAEKYGRNVLTKRKRQSIISRFISAMKEPMMLILMFGFVIAFGSSMGRFLKTGSGEFAECIGILLAVIVSVSITIIMEGSSEKAFDALNKIYENIAVRVIRSGKIITISQQDLIVGDIMLLESGDKVVADGRLIECEELSVDESALTGESQPIKKNAIKVLPSNCALAERVNSLFSGTFIVSGSGKLLITALGDNTEMGGIASELLSSTNKDAPLQAKLSKLGKTITIIGAISAVLVFIISVIRIYLNNAITFDNIQGLFISCIVLIVAAVPEGLPTIVAVSLALNMIKLAKSNALIKKMTATETAGAVSVICSDKTGTLTQNKMQVVSICYSQTCSQPENIKNEIIKQNFSINSTADIITTSNKDINRGSSTECALLRAFNKMSEISYQTYRRNYNVISRQPFSSDTKFMTTTISLGNDKSRTLLKGAPEVVLNMCDLSTFQKTKILEQMSLHQKDAKRIICLAHLDGENGRDKFNYDGFVSIADPIRKDVYKAVLDCKRAGIKIKILTGDNKITAFAIAKELKIATEIGQVIEASDIEKLDDDSLKKMLGKITVIARSTPTTKSRVVKLLKEMGEVVAVTGDGINDAPAIKHADVGIAMGISGSDITKETADIVLLDDSFSTIVKSIAFGRNVYKNLQRFILFQLSVNISALLFITICAIFNMPSPFNTLQLLWINVIMDGPPALTLGLESANSKLMNNPPVKRTESIVGLSMLFRILFNGIYMATIMLMQYRYNFLRLSNNELSGGIFSLFILLQLFNAFNSRELGRNSIFSSIGKNKIMVITFSVVFLLHYLIVQIFSSMFNVNPLSMQSWIKIIIVSFSIIIVSEVYKLLYRILKGKKT